MVDCLSGLPGLDHLLVWFGGLVNRSFSDLTNLRSLVLEECEFYHNGKQVDCSNDYRADSNDDEAVSDESSDLE